MTKMNKLVTAIQAHTPKFIKDLAFKCKEKSPEILFGAGCAFIAVGVGVTISKSKKAIDILEDNKERIALCDIAIKVEDGVPVEKIHEAHPEMTEKQIVAVSSGVPEFKQAIGGDIHYAKVAYVGLTASDLLKTYAPAFAFIALGIICFMGSNKILKNREIAASAACAATAKAYSDYRKRVADEIGTEKEFDIFNGIKHLTVAKEGVDENGMPTVETEEKTTINLENGGSQYSVLFDDLKHEWTPSALQNLEWIHTVQKSLDNRLHARGYLYLYEAYEALGMYYDDIAAKQPEYYGISEEQHWASRHVGWRVKGNGDGHVILLVNGVPVDDILKNRGPASHMDPSFRIDFNVDGEILDTMHSKQK